jgi:uncharacterized membrane protein
MVVYVSLFLGKLHPRHSKVLLGFFGVLGVMLSLSAGFGICGYFGVTFSELIVGVPFIVVGIGVGSSVRPLWKQNVRFDENSNVV